MITRNNGSLKIIFVLLTGLIVFLIFIKIIVNNDQRFTLAYFFMFILLYSLITFFILKQNYNLFEPIFLFSAFYSTVLFAGFYSLSSNFSSNLFVKNIPFHNDIEDLAAIVSFYFFSGYIFTLLGYYFVRQNNKIKLEFESKRIVSDVVINIVVVVFVSIGILNFIHNIIIFAGGNFFVYFSNISMRFHEFSITGTTLGYTLAYNAMYIWLFKLFRRNNRKINRTFLVILLLTIVMKASTGRVFGTLLYITSFIALYYFFEISQNKKIKNRKYYFLGLLLFFSGVLFYFFRIISSLSVNKSLIGGILNELSHLFDLFFFLAVDQGNVPNYGLVLKIVDSWGNDIGFLYGESLLTWSYGFLPSFLRPDGYQPSVLIKNAWYSHLPTGNLPPTGIGEMYANFGILGPFIGMFAFGCLMGYIYNYTTKKSNYWIYVIYVQITIGFIMLYPKGEFDNLSLWMILPIIIIKFFLEFISYTGTTIHTKNCQTISNST